MVADDRNAPSAEKISSVGPVVSASHLAAGQMPALSEIEYALTVVTNAFQRWTVRASAASGYRGLTPLEVLVLHQVNHRERDKTLADLRLVLNIEDTHLVNYAIKKLEQIGLISTGKRGKEKIISISDEGKAACEAYHQLREALLIEGLKALKLDQAELSRIATILRALSGHYDQAARSAASM